MRVNLIFNPNAKFLRLYDYHINHQSLASYFIKYDIFT
jgi:hypothetical protein